MQIELNPEEIKGRVIERTAELFVDNEIGDWIPDIEKEIKNLCNDTIRERVSLALKPLIESEVGSVLIQRTTEFSIKTGHPESLDSFIAQEVRDYLNCYLDYQGKPAKDAYDKKPENKMLNRMVTQEVARIVQASATEAVKIVFAEVGKTLNEVFNAEVNKIAARLQKR